MRIGRAVSLCGHGIRNKVAYCAAASFREVDGGRSRTWASALEEHLVLSVDWCGRPLM